MQLAILNIGQLVTLAGPSRPRVGLELGELGLVSNAGLLIMDGMIAAVDASEVIESALSGDCSVIDAQGCLVTPGWVDAHTHTIFADNRATEFDLRCRGKSYQEIKESGGGIMSTVQATRGAHKEDLVSSANERLQWMLKGGTTTVEVKSGYGLTPESELNILRCSKALGPQRIITTFLGAHAVPPDRDKEEYLAEVIDLLPKVEELASACDIFVEDGYFTADDARRLFASTGLRRRLHVDQFRDSGGALLAAQLGASTADHLEHTGLEGAMAMKEAGVIPVLLPASIYCLGLSKYPDARMMIEEGLPVVLASDFNPGTAPCPSMTFVMSLACTQMKLTPAEALTATTINAAYALGMGDEVGSLEVGKHADFVMHLADDYREIPYWTARETTEQVFIGGSRVL